MMENLRIKYEEEDMMEHQGKMKDGGYNDIDIIEDASTNRDDLKFGSDNMAQANAQKIRLAQRMAQQLPAEHGRDWDILLRIVQCLQERQAVAEFGRVDAVVLLGDARRSEAVKGRATRAP
jgi:hypothetical protein